MEWVEVLAGTRVIVGLPEAAIDDLIAAGEVLVQEGLTAWTVPVSRHAELPRLRSVFGGRVRLGVGDLRDPGQVRLARDVEPDLLLSPFASEDVLRAAESTPIALGALTPAEIARALELGPAAVQVTPCDALGSLYARTVTDLFAGEPLIVTGKLERFQCEMWLDAGALAVCPVGLVGAADVADPDLADLRRRARAHRLG